MKFKESIKVQFERLGKKKLILAGAAAVAIIVLAALIGVKMLNGGKGMAGAMAGAGGRQGFGGAGAQQVNYTVVKTEKPHHGNVYVTSSLTGTIEASDVIYIYAKAAGDVTAVNCKAGEEVKAGDVLIEINTDNLASAQNQLDSAEISYKSAQSDLARMKILFDGGDITPQEYENTQNKAKTAQLQYESAKINYDKQLSYSSITAPIDGVLESISVDVYDHVNNNAELCVIAGEGQQRLTTYVSERMMLHLNSGDDLEVIKNGKTYDGKITEVNSIVDSQTGLFKVKAEIENTNEIATGSTVKIMMVTDRAENAMLVPVDAIYYSGGDAYLYVVEDGIAHMRYVEVGLYDDEVAEILSGIEENELVVSTWSSNLYEGAHVRLFDELNNSSESAERGADGRKQEAGSASDGQSSAENAGGDSEREGRPQNGQGGFGGAGAPGGAGGFGGPRG